MSKILSYTIIFFSLCLSPIIQAQSSLNSDSIQKYIRSAEKLQEEYKYEQSLEIAKGALQNAQYNDDSKSQGYIYNIIGKNYEINGENDRAIPNYLKALTYAQISKSKTLEIDLYNSLGHLYVQNDSTNKKGIAYYDKSYKYANRLRDTLRMIRPLLNMGEFYIHKKNFVTAYKYLSPARKLITPKYSIQDQTKLNVLLGQYFLNGERFQKAEMHIENAISYASQGPLFDELATAYQIKANLFYEKKDYKQAYTLLNTYHENIKKAQDEKKLIELQRANVKYDVDQYRKKIEQADRDAKSRAAEEIKWRISIIFGAILILISLAFLISSYRNNIQKRGLNDILIEKNKELIGAKETAEQVSTLKSQFISTVSHELRTPLYGVIGLTSLLMENPNEKKKNEYLESLKFSGDYLLALINDVLQLSKIETNEVVLEKVTFDIKSLVEGIVNSLHSKQKSNNNIVHINIDPKVNTMLIGDSVRLSQILINLIGNSLKFTENGNIWIAIECLEHKNESYKLRFTIKDDGIGIPKNKQKTIFDNFAQIKNQTQEYEGTGLGLAIVKKLVHLHDSEIYINSEEGKGSEFYFEIEYEKTVKQQNQSPNTNKRLSIGTTNFDILIVDDNKINQIVTQNILKKKGYTCSVANNGMDAIAMLKKEQFDLVLMDINMPEMNGLDATKVIRTFNKTLPIIALTAVEEGEIRDQALSVGMNDVIIKPYDTQQFFQKIMKNISKVKHNIEH